jgi:hypothetical protein
MTGADVAYLLCAAALIVLAALVYRLVSVRWPKAEPEPPAPDGEQFTADDEAFIADLSARMKTYGTQVADRYDTPEGPQ